MLATTKVAQPFADELPLNLSTAQVTESASGDLFGHPRGLFVLFFTEMWERFSYYGMRALLMLYMLDVLRYSTHDASNIYGVYTGLVFLTPLVGGYVADRYLGQRRAVVLGGLLMAAGHFAMCFRPTWCFFAALGLLIIGNGFFKPNIAVVVGKLYRPDDPRRDGAFSIFYMGINIGAFFSPLLCGWLKQSIGWHWGFGAAGIGMLVGLVVYARGSRHLGEHGLWPVPRDTHVGPPGSIASGGLTRFEWRRLLVLLILAVFGNIVFWAVFEQAGSSMAIFADRATNLHIRALEFDVPSAWMQSINPMFIALLAPLFSGLWLSLARHGVEPSTPFKFALGLLFLAAGFGTMVVAGHAFDAFGHQVSMGWLFGAFFLNTCGELCLSPVGLSAVTKLAPPKFASLMMGLWFGSMALANYASGLIAGEYDSMSKAMFFSRPMLGALAASIVLCILVWPLRALMREDAPTPAAR